MIVVCTTCQARFKVADDKIGPRGAKVRCSKCQNVFVVHREPGAMPAEGLATAPPPAARPPAAAPRAIELDLEAGQRPGARPNGFLADPFGRQPASAQNVGAIDPFGAADPFAAPGAPTAPPTDPFASSAPADADPYSAADPFAAPAPGASGATLGTVDPFIATLSPPPPASSLPTSAVTDLSDLLAGGASAPRFDAGAAVFPTRTPPPEPSGILETGFDFDTGSVAGPDLAMETPAHPVRAPAPPEPQPDLALNERTPTNGIAATAMPGFGDFAGVDPFGQQPVGAGAGGPSGLETAAPSGGRDYEGAFGAPTPPPVFAPPVAATTRASEVASAPVPRLAAPGAEPSEAERAADAPRHWPSRLRSLAINAVSLVALLAVALAFLALSRGQHASDGGLFRPAAVLGAIRADQAPFAAERLSSGLYERSDAPPVLFVAGAAVSHDRAAVPGLRVRVEVVRKGAVLARGEVRAGAVPTPEELHGTRDAVGIAAAIQRHAAGVPRAVNPGDAVPFLVAISDFPPDVAGAGLRITVEPIAAEPPPGPAPTPDGGAAAP
jgi:predicted Zn finger-like uncharacterized protein